MSKGNMATLGNLAIFLIVLLLILHITGYVEVRAKTTEGFYYKNKKTLTWVLVAIMCSIGLATISYQYYKEYRISQMM
jgi:heme/copper-type cytochrome/quinol oxidase subunit 2